MPDATVPRENIDDDSTAGRPRRRRRWLRRTFAVLGILGLTAVAGGLIFVRSTAFGASPSGDRQARIDKSPEWHDDEFTNAQPRSLDFFGALGVSLFDSSDTSSPEPALDIDPTDTTMFAVPPSDGLRTTWFGHSSTLVEIDDLRVLIDPFWGKQSGPVGLFGATPFFAAPVALADLAPVDVVLISHDHWDHLDAHTISAMRTWSATTFVVPLGIGAHLERWGIPADRIQELDWWQRATVGTVEFVATPARHSSGRDPLRSNETLWSGWAVLGPQHRLWYSGDSGYFGDLAQIGDRLGPFDVTLIESGQYDPNWPDNHFGPELAVEANALVGGKIMIPVHWALFSLAPHSWTEPVERVRAEAECRGQRLLILVPGVPTEPDPEAVVKQQQWWPALPWRTAADAPVMPTASGDQDQRVDIVPCVLGGP